MALSTMAFRASWLLAAVYAAGAAAQGTLEVTMRVVDDVSNISAVTIVIGNDVAAVAVEEASRAPAAEQRATSTEASVAPAADAAAADGPASEEGQGSGNGEDSDGSEDRVPVQ